MTRKEQITKAGISFTMRNRPVCIGGSAFSDVVEEMNRNYAFEAGAKWADSNPQENLIDIEKACNWLKDRISIPYEVNTNENGEPFAGDYIKFAMERLKMVEEFCEDFRKAMEE